MCVQGAEQLLSRDGEFLVRDSSSSAGEYVLSCMWKNQPMHFKIIRVVLRPKQVQHPSRRLLLVSDAESDVCVCVCV